MTTTTTLTEGERSQIAHIAAYAERSGLTIHEADTEVGRVRFTIESKDGGQVWGEDMLTVNHTPHVLMGHYRMRHQEDYDIPGSWTVDLDRPIAYVGGYPGLKRKDVMVNHSAAPPTENAARKIFCALGQAIAPFFADPTEALTNEREMAAQAMERKSLDETHQAERCLERSLLYQAEATSIRNGGTYDARGL